MTKQKGYSKVSFQHYTAAVVRGVIASQIQLDARGLELLESWDETGIPPTFFAWTQLRLQMPIRYFSLVKALPRTGPQFGLQPGQSPVAYLRLSLRYCPSLSE